MNTTQSFPSVAKFALRRYGAPVAANSATGFGHSVKQKAHKRRKSIARRFFTSVAMCHGGCAWGIERCAGFLLPRLTNLRTVRLLSFGHEVGGSPAKRAVLMKHALIPSRIRAAAHRAMAMAALHADSSLSVRLKRYNTQMAIARTLETAGAPDNCAKAHRIQRNAVNQGA